MPLAARFIRDALPKEGVNVLVLELDYRYQFTRHPEVVDTDPLSSDDVAKLVAAAKDAGVRLIPEINCLGHQSWDKTTLALLRTHPEFDETPGQYPQNQGIYCRSYCPLHPAVHDVLFDLIDELTAAFGSDAFHVGMDEVFLLGEDACPRCKGKDKAELFAQEVRTLHDHLAKTNRSMWMWGDRFLNGDVSGMGKWEASLINTQAAIHAVPKDIMICDWHYQNAVPTAGLFAIEGFNVVSAPWRQTNVALAQLELIRSVRANANETIAPRMQGVLQTTWCDMGAFVKAYYGDDTSNKEALEAANCFKALFSAIRNSEPK
ncbi:MAG TPA: family 20 glycosylhydrolase [Terriglobales bacterium]|nr:family 20 glycosylhydrolase [Terriglobales bacterium]